VGVNNVKICLHSIQNLQTPDQKNCSDSYQNQTPCMLHPTEVPFFSMPPKEAADIIFKGISELQIKNPKIARILEKIIIFNIDYKDIKTKEVLNKFEKDLESILKNNKTYGIVKRLDTDETSNLLLESALYDYPILDNNFYYLFTGDNLFNGNAIIRTTNTTTNVLRLESSGFGANNSKSEIYESAQDFYIDLYDSSSTLRNQLKLTYSGLNLAKGFIKLENNIGDKVIYFDNSTDKYYTELQNYVLRTGVPSIASHNFRCGTTDEVVIDAWRKDSQQFSTSRCVIKRKMQYGLHT
jgi:hypothetical protein